MTQRPKMSDNPPKGKCMACGKKLSHNSTGYCYYCTRVSDDLADIRWFYKRAREAQSGKDM